MLKALLAGAAALAIAGAANAATYAIQAGRLIVDAAQPARGNSTVIVDDGRITRIDSGFTAPPGAIVVDERSRTVMPGMTDVHVHLTFTSGEPWYEDFTIKESAAYKTTRGLTHALEMARAGFTTVRDLGGDTAGVIAVRDAVAEGSFPGPRIKVSGEPLSIIGGHYDLATGRPPKLVEAINEAHLSPSVCTGVEEWGSLPAPIRTPAYRLTWRKRLPDWLDGAWLAAHDVVIPGPPKTVAASMDLQVHLRDEVRSSLRTLLRYEDRNSMAFSIESRVPYVTPAIVEFAAGLPDDYPRRSRRDREARPPAEPARAGTRTRSSTCGTRSASLRPRLRG